MELYMLTRIPQIKVKTSERALLFREGYYDDLKGVC